ncbi:MAG: hypothetical protein WC461_03075 [Candidatus Paceibacterota bacterium]
MSKLNKILLAVVIVLIIALVVLIYWQNFKKSDNSDYWAVFLTSGDLYIGKIGYFPSYHLSDVWLIQRTSDEKNPYSVGKFAQAIWGPGENLYINDDQIVWKNKLSPTSQMLNYIKNPQSAQQVNEQTQPTTETTTTEK